MIKTGASLLHSVLLFFTVMLQLMSIPALGRDKTDVIILKNGDHITGEIKSLSRGKMSLSTDSMGTVSIEWEDVARVTSQWVFEVETETGLRTFGSLSPAAEPKTMEIIGEGTRNTLNQTSVVRLTQLEAGFLSRLEGYVDVGFNFARANRATQWTLGSEVKSRNEIRQLKSTFSSFFDDRKDVESTTRNVFTFDFTRFFSGRWLVTGLTSFTQNQELNLDLRSSFGGDLGRHVIQNNRSLLTVRAGAVFSKEQFAPTEFEPMGENRNNIEATGTLAWELFSFQDPEIDITTTLTVLPSLSNWGRIRADFDTRIQFELFKDFSWSATLFDNYDSRPPEGNETNDFGITTSVGWSF
ncbi:MAG: DUF481 domain-containing protein [Acidobacteriota bacterium]